jgi:hypothetical protein
MIEKNAHFTVTEWMWLKMSLRVYSVSTRSQLYSVYFDFREDEEPEIVCRIFAEQIQKMVESRDPRPVQEEYYWDWASKEKKVLADIVTELPVLSKAFDADSTVLFQFMHHYGMGSSVLCEIRGSSISWRT